MNYKLHDTVFLKKEAEIVYLYSLENESLVVQTTGFVASLMELLKNGCKLSEVENLLKEADVKTFNEIYSRLTAAGFTIASSSGNESVKEETFSYPAGSIRFSTFEDFFGYNNASVYASYCATSSCSYCDNCTCSDC